MYGVRESCMDVWMYGCIDVRKRGWPHGWRETRTRECANNYLTN